MPVPGGSDVVLLVGGVGVDGGVRPVDGHPLCSRS
jgi:hypothetical protein